MAKQIRGRDRQRSRVYAWEKHCQGVEAFRETMTLAEVEAFAAKVWLAERVRYGRGRMPPPSVHHGRGQRRALAYTGKHVISLPKFARNPYIVLHELAHLLTPVDEAHGPRFVGVVVGLAARWLNQDAQVLLRQADAMGVRVNRNSVGKVPTRRLSDYVMQALPGDPAVIALRINVEYGLNTSYRQVLGAAIQLLKHRKVRWHGDALIAVSA